MTHDVHVETHRAVSARTIIPLLGVLAGGAVIVFFWPDAALADDCLRDPYNAEDCLRTSGWAPVMAGGVVWMTSIFAALGEIKNTLASLAERAAAELSKGAKDVYDAGGQLYDIGGDMVDIVGDELSATGDQMLGEMDDMYDTAGSYWDRFSIRNIFPNAPWYQDTMDAIFGAQTTIAESQGESTASVDEARAENKRRTSFADNASMGLRLLAAALTGGLAAVAGVAVLPAVVIGAIGFFLPDAVSWATSFMTSRK